MNTDYYRSPVGTLKIASNGNAIKSITLVNNEAKGVGDKLTKMAATELDEYFAGKRTQFEFPVDPDGTDFQKRVWNALLTIPYGKAISYGEVAKLVGNKNACRAVGNAVGKNPILIAIPCHRVRAANGIGGFSAGIEVKEYLIKKENIIL